MNGHGIIKCEICGIIISQCKCMTYNKTIKYKTCEKCKSKIISTKNIIKK